MSAIRRFAIGAGTLLLTVLFAVTALAPPASAATVSLTEAAAGSTVAVRTGDTIVVSLPAPYDPITLTGTALVLRSTSGGFPTGQPLLATYGAVATGTADLRTMTDYVCLHQAPRCALPQKLWLVHVVVIH